MPAVLHRSRADWPIVLASWLLLTCAVSLLAAGTLYTDAVTLAGLHRELRESPASDRAVVVRTKILPDRLAAADAAIVPELEALLGPTGGSVVRVRQSSPYADAAADPSTVEQLTVFASYEGIEDHADLVDGRWPTPGRTPVEAALSERAAALLGVGVGDIIVLRSRLDESREVEVRVTGRWAADHADEWWMGEQLALTGTQTGGSFTTRGPLIVAPDDLVTGPLADPVNAEWRAVPRVDGFTPQSIASVADLAAGIDARINAALPFTNQAEVQTKLPAILASVDRSVLVTQAGILLLLVQFGVLAAYAVILVAALLLERRRTETALLRARGGGFGHLVAMALGEALLVTLPAMIAAPWAAALLVQGVRLNPALEGVGLEAPLPGPTTFGVALFAGVIAILALTVPTLVSGAPIAGVRAAVGRRVGASLPQRLGLDLALVVLAVIALVQLRLYGAPITRTARGALGVDPLLVAAPAIGLLAGAVLAVRIVPRVAELAERLLARGRRLVPALAGRQVARRPMRYTRAALLLILAAALGTFASAHAATWTRSQGDQASYAAGADVRVTPDPQGAVPTWGLGEALRATPGVTAATPVEKASIELGTTLRDGVLLGIDGTTMSELVRVRDDADGGTTTDGLAALGATRPQ
ncbi:MAG TPA: FtsX-like permease family protein, partial [Candidatus Limnocylindrales bacterium]|nr:FtsX-like permease family protein [Candidatus Limnocylindrales bacterium]